MWWLLLVYIREKHGSKEEKKNNNLAVGWNQIQSSHSFLLKAAVNDLQ